MRTGICETSSLSWPVAQWMGGVEMGSHVLAPLERVPVPCRTPVVVAAQLAKLPPGGVDEGLWEPDQRCLFRERLSEVDDVDRAVGETMDQ